MPLTCVLIVEDDPLILLVTAEDFRALGCIVVEAKSVDDGFALLAAGDSAIEAVFTDIETPGALSGVDLAHLAASTWPTLAVVVTSGRLTPTPGALPPTARFVPKPYTVERVASLFNDLKAEQNR